MSPYDCSFLTWLIIPIIIFIAAMWLWLHFKPDRVVEASRILRAAAYRMGRGNDTIVFSAIANAGTILGADIEEIENASGYFESAMCRDVGYRTLGIRPSKTATMNALLLAADTAEQQGD